MYILFFICVIGIIAAVPIHFQSVEHLKFQEKYGKEKGVRFMVACQLICCFSR